MVVCVLSQRIDSGNQIGLAGVPTQRGLKVYPTQKELTKVLRSNALGDTPHSQYGNLIY